MKAVRLLAPLVAVAALSACKKPETPAGTRLRMAAEADSIRPEIESRMAAYARYYNALQTDSIVALHTADAHVMAPNMPTAAGTDAVRRMFEAAFAPGSFGTLVLRTEQVTANGLMAVERGRYDFVPAPEAPVPADSGKYLARWDRVEGTWLIADVMWNSDVPPPAPEPEPAQRR